ncbi:MAG: helix-turn-helix transcriptional regulator [Burkholderiaceae bacterium]
MSDFASAAMVRVLIHGMRERGLMPPDEAQAAGSRLDAAARVPLDLKRAVIADAVRRGGIGCLALLGCGLSHYRNDPTHRALASARGVADLLERWQRLERYVHSRHRCQLLKLDDLGASRRCGGARLRHVAVHGPAPLAAESLVVLGLLIALLEALGLQQVRACAGGVPVYPEPDAAALQRAAAAGGTAAWRLDWVAAPGSAESSRASTASTASASTVSTAPPADLLHGPDWPPLLVAAARLLLNDLTQPLTLPSLAGALGFAPRTLQRALSDAGTGYAPLLAELRCRAAAWWLLHSQRPVAEIGFVCGFADQAHFTRELRRRVGLPPLRYRQAFTT